jgi:hypothetical protein
LGCFRTYKPYRSLGPLGVRLSDVGAVDIPTGGLARRA